FMSCKFEMLQVGLAQAACPGGALVSAVLVDKYAVQNIFGFLEQAVRFSYIALGRFHFSKSSKITRQIVTITDAATRLKADLQRSGCLIEIAKPAVSVSNSCRQRLGIIISCLTDLNGSGLATGSDTQRFF